MAIESCLRVFVRPALILSLLVEPVTLLAKPACSAALQVRGLDRDRLCPQLERTLTVSVVELINPSPNSRPLSSIWSAEWAAERELCRCLHLRPLPVEEGGPSPRSLRREA